MHLWSIVCPDKRKGENAMEMKNICGKIPVELHAKVRNEIENREISTQEFLQQVIEEHFMEKGVDSMAARTIAVQVTEELFGRLKAVVARKGCKQKDFLIGVIEAAVAAAEEELEREQQNPQEQTAGEEAGEENACGESYEAEENSETENGLEEEPYA
jgi:hypothetical protein